MSTGCGRDDSGGVSHGLNPEKRGIWLQAVLALQHGVGVSNVAPGLGQVSSRQTVRQADRLSARPLNGANIYGFPASAYALEAAVPAMSTDAYPCRQMDDKLNNVAHDPALIQL